MRNCSRPKYGRQKHRVRERSCFYAGKTHSQVSFFLQEAHPGNKGFSSWSVSRFCLKNGLHAEYQTCQIKRWITVRMKLLLGWVFLLEFFLLICTFFTADWSLLPVHFVMACINLSSVGGEKVRSEGKTD